MRNIPLIEGPEQSSCADRGSRAPRRPEPTGTGPSRRREEPPSKCDPDNPRRRQARADRTCCGLFRAIAPDDSATSRPRERRSVHRTIARLYCALSRRMRDPMLSAWFGVYTYFVFVACRHVETRGARARARRGIAVGTNPDSAPRVTLLRVLVSTPSRPRMLKRLHDATPPRNHGACTRTNGLPPPCSSATASPRPPTGHALGPLLIMAPLAKARRGRPPDRGKDANGSLQLLLQRLIDACSPGVHDGQPARHNNDQR